MFNDKYGLTQAVLEGRKTQTRRTFLKPGEDPLLHGITPEYLISVRSRYSLGETIAIAQKYEDLAKNDDFFRLRSKKGVLLGLEKGCHNKMFVRADLMPHHIRITNIRVERLQDISEEDCMAEGIRRFGKEYVRFKKEYCYTCQNYAVTDFYSFSTPREAYAALIDKISGKGTWENNPWVFVYDFEFVK